MTVDVKAARALAARQDLALEDPAGSNLLRRDARAVAAMIRSLLHELGNLQQSVIGLEFILNTTRQELADSRRDEQRARALAEVRGTAIKRLEFQLKKREEQIVAAMRETEDDRTA